MSLNEMYREIVLEHSKQPRNYGKLENADCHGEGFNPLCGDQISVDLKLDPTRKKLNDIRFTGKGCSICMASASMMTEEVQGTDLTKALKTIQDFRDVMQGIQDPEIFETDVSALSGVRQFPVRIKCALLAWTTLKEAVEKCSTDYSK